MIVLWRVTDRCNLACGFCAHDRRLLRPRQDADPQQVLRLAHVLARWQHERGRDVLLSWLGGEPLLWPPLLALDRQIAALGVRLSQTSNGTRLGDAVIRAHLLEHYAELTLSIDAAGPVHDQLRGFRHGYQRLRRSVALLLEERARRGSRLRLRVNSVLMRQTIDSYPELALELAQAGVDELSFNALGGRDRPEFYPEARIQPLQWERFRERLPALRSELQALGVRLPGQPAYLQRIAAATQDLPVAVHDCGPGRQFLFIDAAGRAAPCSQTVDEYGIDVAELGDSAALDALPQRFARMRSEVRALSCADCPSTHVWGKFGSVKPGGEHELRVATAGGGAGGAPHRVAAH